MNGLPYYKRYPRDFFEGTIGMPLELKGPYSIVLDLIYMQNGALLDDPRYIAGHLGCSVRQWNSVRERLITIGKIEARDGHLGNYRADKELVSSHLFQDKQRENGAKGGKIKGLKEAVAKPKPSQPEPEPEYTEAKASDASVDFAKQLLDRGVAFLGKHGTPDKPARAIIGKWRNAYQDTEIYEAFAACSKQGVIDPIPWITARLKGKDKANGKSDKQQRKLNAFIAGSTGAPPMDSGPDLYPSLPLLARG